MMKKEIFARPLIPRKRAGVWLTVFGLLTAAVIGYIFYNSLQSAEDSARQSAAVVDRLKPLVGMDNGSEDDGFAQLVRKLAHMIEFALLGFCIGGLMVGTHALMGRWYAGTALFIALLVGVADEFLQSFTGRGSMVADVLIDFSGALLGMLPTVIFVVVMYSVRKRSGDDINKTNHDSADRA